MTGQSPNDIFKALSVLQRCIEPPLKGDAFYKSEVARGPDTIVIGAMGEATMRAKR